MEFRRFPSVLLLAILLASAPECFAAFEAFLKMPGIDGESTDPQHKNWITIVAFTNSVPRKSKIIRPPLRVQPSELILSKQMDKASPLLLKAARSGKAINEVLLELCHSAGGSTFAFYHINLSNAVVWSVEQTGGSYDTLPEELLVLRYERIAWTYTTMTITGEPGERIGSYWDLLHNRGGMLSNLFTLTATQNEWGELVLNWSAQVGKTYKIYAGDTVDGNFTLVAEVLATGQAGKYSEPMLGRMRFYKVE